MVRWFLTIVSQMILDDCWVGYPQCTNRHDGKLYGDCGSPFAPVFFLGYIIVCKATMINLFVGMIINNFSYCSDRDNNGALTEDDLEEFREIWTEIFDQSGTSFIPLNCVYQLMWKIGRPLGFHGSDGNLGRYLCAREDLRAAILDDQMSTVTETSTESNHRYGPITRLLIRCVYSSVGACVRVFDGDEVMSKTYKRSLEIIIGADLRFRSPVCEVRNFVCVC